MKKKYEKPQMVVEEYEINQAIAAGCQRTLSLGPESHMYNGTQYDTCKEFEIEEFDSVPTSIVASVGNMDEMSEEVLAFVSESIENSVPMVGSEAPASMSFFQGKCSCYLSAGGSTVFTS